MTARPPIIHYAGGVKYTRADGVQVQCQRGWACCCSGDRAEEIKKAGAFTLFVDGVSCKACLVQMKRAKESLS